MIRLSEYNFTEHDCDTYIIIKSSRISNIILYGIEWFFYFTKLIFALRAYITLMMSSLANSIAVR